MEKQTVITEEEKLKQRQARYGIVTANEMLASIVSELKAINETLSNLK